MCVLSPFLFLLSLALALLRSSRADDREFLQGDVNRAVNSLVG